MADPQVSLLSPRTTQTLKTSNGSLTKKPQASSSYGALGRTQNARDLKKFRRKASLPVTPLLLKDGVASSWVQIVITSRERSKSTIRKQALPLPRLVWLEVDAFSLLGEYFSADPNLLVGSRNQLLLGESTFLCFLTCCRDYPHF